jgi:glyoxylase-like metal-dependent hydrolase (beta-lactamase superfamily II)
MAFLTESEPDRLVAMTVHPGVRRMVAPNPGPMTYTGTNTWLIDGADGLTVIDPGPDDPAHLNAIAAQGRVSRVVLTHTHPDHLAGAPALRTLTGAPIHAFHAPWAQGFTPDVALRDGDAAGPLNALHTPGHASDHLCFALSDTSVLFTGDHVMSWNTSIVSPPDGDMGAYMASLRLLLSRDDALYLCGHGPPLPNPLPLVRAMLSHRAGREASVLAALRDGPLTESQLVDRLYVGLESHLVPAARRTVLAHLHKLLAERRVRAEAKQWQTNETNP